MKAKIEVQQKLLERANYLLESLGKEKTRWQKTLKNLTADEEQICLNVSAISYYMAYLSNKEEQFAQKALDDFIKLNFKTGEFSVLEFISELSTPIF